MTKEGNRFPKKFYNFEFDLDDLGILTEYLGWAVKTAGSKSAIGNIELVIPGPWDHDNKKKKLIEMVYTLQQIHNGNYGPAPETVDETKG